MSRGTIQDEEPSAGTFPVPGTAAGQELGALRGAALPSLDFFPHLWGDVRVKKALWKHRAAGHGTWDSFCAFFGKGGKRGGAVWRVMVSLGTPQCGGGAGE